MAAFRQLLRQLFATFLASNFTTTNATATSTALSFNIGANETWVVDVQLTAQCSSTGGVKYAIAAPAGATIEGWLYSSTSAITTLSYQRIAAINTLTGTLVHTVATTPAPDVIRFTITNSSTAGAVTIQAASGTSGQTTTIFAKSSLKALRAA
jgi:hypothetical protein